MEAVARMVIESGRVLSSCPRSADGRRALVAAGPMRKLESLSSPNKEMEKVREMLVLDARDESWLGLPEGGSSNSMDTAIT